MSFDANEIGVESGQPIELYQFTLGSSHTRLTSSENDVTIPSTLETFVAQALTRSNIVQESSDPGSQKLSVRMPASHPLVQQYRNIAPGRRATLTIYRMHRADLGVSDERQTIFKGSIRNVAFADDGRVAVMTVLPVTSAYSKPTPRRTYQGLCSHMLYDARCTINRDDPAFRHDGTVTAVSGDTVTVSGAATFSGALADFFVAGYLEVDGDFRTVVAQSGDVLTIVVPFLESPLGKAVVARAGCKQRAVEDCEDKFNNLVNFGGFPYVPKSNPFETGIF